jgi:SAM-dependent methyltransferase
MTSSSIPLMTSEAHKPADYYQHVRREMLPFFPPQITRALDVGCGDGRFGQLIKATYPGSEVWGVEPSAEAHSSASKILDHAVLGYFDETLALPDEHFDVIVFNDSLEHFSNHIPALALARRLLKPQGVVVASIPNVRYWPHVQHYLLESDWRYESAGILDRTHLRFFTRKSMLRDFSETGFEVQKIEGINPCWIGFKFRLLQTLFPRLMSDMPFQQFAIRATKQNTISHF